MERLDPNIRAIIEIEKERLRVQERRSEVALAGINAGDAADRREYEFQLARLNSDKEERAARFRFGSRFVPWAGVFAALFLMTVSGLVFWGNPTQQRTALSILKYFLVALAGWGFISQVARFVRRLFDNP